MFFTKASLLFGAAALIGKVSAHGIVTGIVADNTYYEGYSPNFQYSNTPPSVAGWSTPKDGSLGFVNDTSSPDIVCHIDATPGTAYVTVAAGGTVELQWTKWPVSHHGPVIDYLASCDGDCTTVDKTKLLFSKIDEGGLIDGAPSPGTWASDTLIANNNSWTVTIPPEIAPGKYVLRHEIIALHSAYNISGFQAYPQCINLEITGAGTDTLSTGTVAQDFYKPTDPGLFVSIYWPVLTNYTIPGPPLIADAVSASQSSIPESATATATPTSGTSSDTTYPIPTSATATATPTSDAWSNTTYPTTAAPAAPETDSTTTTTTTTTTTIPDTAPPTYAADVSATSSPDSWPSSDAAPTSPAAWGSTDGAAAATSTTAASTAWGSTDAWGSATAVASTPAAAASTFGISFTSTFTGRIGKPTKFTCYIDEDWSA